MMDQLPAIIPPGALAPLDVTHLVPALIANKGKHTGRRHVEFFTANIRKPNMRRTYALACGQFFAWCDDRGLTLRTASRQLLKTDGWRQDAVGFPPRLCCGLGRD
jgi:hypothetical protein